jgi:hypothetical protein
LATVFVGILDGCLRSRTLDDETIAWARYRQDGKEAA